MATNTTKDVKITLAMMANVIFCTFVEQNDNISLKGYILQSYIASEDDLADFLNNIVDGHLGQMGFDRLTSPSSLSSRG